jgi:NAD(P)-dependent dehydrogenase (short-subunit alcohol dehydrogenase family)
MSESLEYFGKVVLVTGGARGIGFSIARRFARAGARVVIADINVAAGNAALAALQGEGGTADFVACDLSKPGGATRMVRDTVARCGNLNVLVNNARAGQRLGLLEETEENWDLGNNVGLKSAFFAAQAAVKVMSDREGGSGSILNVASVAAMLTTNEAPSYHAVKSGLVQLTRYLATTAGRHRVRVNAVLPGLIVQDEHRPRFEAADNANYRKMTAFYQPLGEVGAAADVAEAALFLCSSRAHYISGACLVIDGGATVQEQFGMLLRWADTAKES